jgi:hypothetical protein
MLGFLAAVGIFFIAVLIFIGGVVVGAVLGSRAANPGEDGF